MKDEAFLQSCDLLLVNLPHDSIGHLPKVLPLLRREQTTVLRGWAIVQRDQQGADQKRIQDAITQAGGTIQSFKFDEVKGFSASKSFMRFEVWMRLEV